MRRYALYLAYAYAIYVTINLIAFAMKNTAQSRDEMIFGVVYMILALLVTWGTAIILTRRSAELA